MTESKEGKVKRWQFWVSGDIGEGGAAVEADEYQNGDYVLYEDYARLEAERDALFKALKNVVDGNDLAHSRDADLHDWPTSAFRRQALEALEPK